MWSLRFRMPLRPRRVETNAPPPLRELLDPITPELDQLVRSAFPRAAASESLRERVAGICLGAAAASEEPVPHRPAPVRISPAGCRLVLAGTLALLILLPILAGRQWAGVAYAAPTAGRLVILDAGGNAAGLCPLKHTDVTADVTGYVARVTVKQEFHNPSETPVEAVYTFPLPEDAAVDAMTMTLGDRIVKGEIKRREEARQIYETARAAGQAAALLDQERPNIFTQSVANIMPGQKVTISISYVNLLKYDEGRYEFAFPMVVGPRYIPDSGGYQAPGLRGNPSPSQRIEGDPGATAVVTDAEKITPPITPPDTRAGHDISLTVNLDAGMPIQEVSSVLHQVHVETKDPAHATVRLREQNELPNKDFILRYAVAGDQIRTSVLTQSTQDRSGYFTLIVQPPKTSPQEKITPKEMVFVIDQTGSQSGWPIKKAKETMRYLVRNMNPGDTFQLLGFNTEVYPCFEAPVHNTPENVARALRFLEPIEGEGGTDILQAVDYALKIKDDPGRRRIICYLTDGYVGDDMQIVDYVKKHRGRAHMFPFGIGNGVNRFLIEGMAKEGHGVAEYVTLKSSAEEAAARFYRRVTQPLLVEVGVDWNGLPVEEVYPREIPDLFVSGRPIILKGRYTRPAEGEITLHGAMEGRPWKQTVHVSFGAEKGSEAISTLWAREKIEDLQGRDWLGAQTGTPNPEITKQIIQVALEHRLMSQYTSFVAVEQRVVNLGGKQRTVDVPVEMPEGVSYDGIFGGEGRANPIAEEAELRETAGEGDGSDRLLFGDGHVKSRKLNGMPRRARIDLGSGTEQELVGRTRWYRLEKDSGGSVSMPAATPPLPAIANPVPATVVSGPESAEVAGRPGAALATRAPETPALLPEVTVAPGYPATAQEPLVAQAPVRRPSRARPARPARFSPMTGRGFFTDAPGRRNGDEYSASRGENEDAGVLPRVGVSNGPAYGANSLSVGTNRGKFSPQVRKRKQTAPAAKIAPALRGLAGKVKDEGQAGSLHKTGLPEVIQGRTAVQVWVAPLPPDGLRKLRALGFEVATELRPGMLLLGMLPVDRLESLARLDFVLYIEPPRFK
jgi:Ca-activated chloride channel homolog